MEDFILKLGCLDQNNRYTAAEGLGHPFITRNAQNIYSMTASEGAMMYMGKLDLKKILKILAFTANMVEKSHCLEI